MELRRASISRSSESRNYRRAAICEVRFAAGMDRVATLLDLFEAGRGAWYRPGIKMTDPGAISGIGSFAPRIEFVDVE
jgi:hypothetical protein